MENEVTLLGFRPSIYTMRVKIALEEKGIKYEYIEEDIRFEKSPLLLQTNPVHKKVPVLIHNRKPVCESGIIVQYIDDTWNDRSPFMPSDPYQRAVTRFWGDYVEKKVYDLGRKVCLTKGENQEAAKKNFLECLKVLEKELGDKAYFGGEDIGYVDVLLIPSYSWFYSYETCGNFRVAGECPKLVAWAHRCMEKENLANALSDPVSVYEIVLLLKKKYGVE